MLSATGLLVALALLAVAVLLAGCSKDLGKPHPNSPPETGVFVQGPLDTVRYSVKLYWWGQDVDGEVVGYRYQWTVGADEPDPAKWIPPDGQPPTTETSKDFVLPVPDGFSLQTFWVKAVDDKYEEDPTPASQEFPVSNKMPSVTLDPVSRPDTTLPAVTFSWTGTDPDGNNSIAYYLIWLDGKEDSPLAVVQSDTTIGPDYLDSYGNRTFYVRAVDEAQGSSAPDSHTWYVLEPKGDVLLVDDVPPTVAGAATTDAFYRSLLDSLVPNQYTVFDIASQGTFRSPAEVSLILPLFRQVVWYGDTRTTPSAALALGQGGIGEFMDGGGNFYVEGIATVGDNGSFTPGFIALYFGIDSLRTRYISSSQPNSTNFDLLNGWVLRGNPSEGQDSLRVSGILSGCEIPYVSSSALTLFYLPPGTMSGQTENYYLGTLTRASGYSAVCLTFPVRRCNGFANARQEVAKLLTILGVGQ